MSSRIGVGGVGRPSALTTSVAPNCFASSSFDFDEVDGDDARRAAERRALDDVEPDAAAAEDGDGLARAAPSRC